MSDRLEPGTRVYVLHEESEGVVVADHGFDRRADNGVDVRLDSDGATVSCAHDQVNVVHGER